MILKYIGKATYLDPFARFIADQNDLIDFNDEEAEKLLKEYPKLFEKVAEDILLAKGE